RPNATGFPLVEPTPCASVRRTLCAAKTSPRQTTNSAPLVVAWVPADVRSFGPRNTLACTETRLNARRVALPLHCRGTSAFHRLETLAHQLRCTRARRD